MFSNSCKKKFIFILKIPGINYNNLHCVLLDDEHFFKFNFN